MTLISGSPYGSRSTGKYTFTQRILGNRQTKSQEAHFMTIYLVLKGELGLILSI